MAYPTSEEIIDLLNKQLTNWELADANYKALSTVKVREIHFDKFVINVQFNPARIQSSAAKVDAKSIQERKCFLCPSNLPSVQEGIAFGEAYQVLVNPFPIFPLHFTIPTYEHTDQLIADRYTDMLDMAKSLDRFVLFYNGPKCGASAPDHAHFQAGNKGFMPIEKDIQNIDKILLSSSTELKLYSFANYLRSGFLIESSDKQKALDTFQRIYNLLEVKESENEPMLNLITWYESGKWISCIFPRKQHRPSCYFAEGDANILLSPASVDLGGVLITPLEKDFDKITKEDIEQLLNEVCLDDASMKKIVENLKNNA